MTKLLYMEDFDVTSCEAEVVEVTGNEDGRTTIILDQTSCYPRGGGQDWDTAKIACSGFEFDVQEVRLDEHGKVHHIGESNTNEISVGNKVRVEVDKERRQVNTRLHSAGHVIDMAVDSLDLGWVPGKGQHYPHLSAIEYSGEWDPDKVESIKQSLTKVSNEYIKKGSDNKLIFVPVEEMQKYCKYVPDTLPTNKPGRVVMYGEFGIPCGGTHVKDISSVGSIRINKLKFKKGTIRLSYSVVGIN